MKQHLFKHFRNRVQIGFRETICVKLISKKDRYNFCHAPEIVEKNT